MVTGVTSRANVAPNIAEHAKLFFLLYNKLGIVCIEIRNNVEINLSGLLALTRNTPIIDSIGI